MDVTIKNKAAGVDTSETLDLNTIEPHIEREKQQLEDEVKRSAWLKKGEQIHTPTNPINLKQAADNKVESDEVFTASQSDGKPIVPTEIEKKYLRVGDKFYHPKNTELIAFEDKGNKLETKSNSEHIADSMVRIAEARGWDEIKVSGSEIFRREVWLRAASRGMHIKGYSPTEQDKAELAKKSKETAINKLENTQNPFRGRENEGAPNTDNKTHTTTHQTTPIVANQKAPINQDSHAEDTGNTLITHGKAKYLHDKNNTASYYVTTRDNNGKEKTLWGVDLQRALAESGAKIGDKIFINHEGKKDVIVDAKVLDSSGQIVDVEKKETIRNTWNIQMAKAFAKELPYEAVKKYPELASSVATASAIEKKVEMDGLAPAQRAIVNARVRQNIVNSIERGDIPIVKLRESIEVKREKQEEREYSR